MKKTFKTMLALMAGTLAFAACQKEDLLKNDAQLHSELKEMTFTAIQEGQDEETKATIDGNKIKWASGDKISVFDGGAADDAGHIDREFVLSDGAGTTAGKFSGSAADGAATYYALYPYMPSTIEERVPTKAEAEKAAGNKASNLDYWRVMLEYSSVEDLKNDELSGISEPNQTIIIAYLMNTKLPFPNGVQQDGDKFSNVIIPYEQVATVGSADPKAMLMMAKSTDASTLQFKNVCAYVKVTPKFDCIAICLRSKGTENLVGTVTVDYNNGEPSTTVNANGSNEVLLTGTITADNTYYIAVRPEALSSGFTISFAITDVIYNKSTTNALNLTRSNVINLGSFDKSNLISIPVTGKANAEIGGSDVEVKWIQLWENGPKFAEYNVGVTDGKAESYGGYYAWGGSQDKVDDHNTTNTGSGNLSGNDDTATKLWGSKWRMPTADELGEKDANDNYIDGLLGKCDVEWTTVNNVKGCKFTGRGAYVSNSLFLPAAGNRSSFTGNVAYQSSLGRYWSSTPSTYNGGDQLFISESQSVMVGITRETCSSVRAVLAE